MLLTGSVLLLIFDIASLTSKSMIRFREILLLDLICPSREEPFINMSNPRSTVYWWFIVALFLSLLSPSLSSKCILK